MNLLDRPGDHAGDELFLVGLRNALGRDQRSVAQNGDAVGQLKDFFQPVGNIDDGDPSPSGAQSGASAPLARQVGGGLIEDQEASAARGRASGRD